MKLVKTIKKNKTVKLNFKGLKKGKYYKYMVVAYKNVNGQKMPMSSSVRVVKNVLLSYNFLSLQ